MNEMQKAEDELENERASSRAKEEKLAHLRQMLIDSQVKWNSFSNKLLKISEDLYFLLEQTGAIESVNEQWIQEAVGKLNTYRNFLMKYGDLDKNQDDVSSNFPMSQPDMGVLDES